MYLFYILNCFHRAKKSKLHSEYGYRKDAAGAGVRVSPHLPMRGHG